MPDPGMMLKDLEGFRGSSRRPWLVIVAVVTLATLGGILLVRHLERGKTAAPDAGTRPAAAPAAVAPAGAPGPGTAAPPAAGALPAEAASLLARAQADEAADQLLAAQAKARQAENGECGHRGLRLRKPVPCAGLPARYGPWHPAWPG